MIIIDVIVLIVVIILIKTNAERKEFENISKKIKISNKEIIELIEKREDLIISICKAINTLQEDDIFLNLDKIKEGDDFFKRDRLTSNYEHDLNEYIIINKNFIPSENIKEEIDQLKNIQPQLIVLKKFHNRAVDQYNNFLNKTFVVKNKKELDHLFSYSIYEEKLFKILDN